MSVLRWLAEPEGGVIVPLNLLEHAFAFLPVLHCAVDLPLGATKVWSRHVVEASSCVNRLCSDVLLAHPVVVAFSSGG